MVTIRAMEKSSGVVAGNFAPPSRLYERLSYLSDYNWDESVPPLQSSYDNWHVYGTKRLSPSRKGTSSSASHDSSHNSPRSNSRPPLRHFHTGASDPESDASISKHDELERTHIDVFARVSTHVLRLEREFQLCRSLIQTSDPGCNHTVRPLDFFKLPGRQEDERPVVVSVFASPGRNALRDLIDFGPAFWDSGQRQTGSLRDPETPIRSDIPISTFLDFAVGTCKCLELLHHGLRVVHGELRGDAFHFHLETGSVKLMNFGSGPRSFENGLTSAGWSTLSKEQGLRHKLQFIAPEQTGRMPAEPDSRTDIYSLGVLFYNILAQVPAVAGVIPLEIVQNILGRSIPPISVKRMDVPDAISSIILRMTQKQIDERYHSASGLKHDLLEVQRMLGDGDEEALKNFQIGRKDVPSFFVLPTAIFGRHEEHEKIVKVIDKMSRRQLSLNPHGHPGQGSQTWSSTTSTSDSRYIQTEAGDTISSDTSSQRVNMPGPDRSASEAPPTFIGNATNIQKSSELSVETTMTITSNGSADKRSGEQAVDGTVANCSSTSGSNGFLSRQRENQNTRRRGRTEIVVILGAAGLGKSSLIQSVQADVRRRGYFASAKFDRARKAPFEPLLRVMSSLFRQIFSEAILTGYHSMIRTNLRSIWPLLCEMLDLPSNLINGNLQNPSQQFLNHTNPLLQEVHNASNGRNTNPNQTLSSAIIRGTGTSQSLKFLNTFVEVLRILTTGKLICLCLDDLQFADEESLELITNIVVSRLQVVLITSCRDEDNLPAKVRTMLRAKDASTTRLPLSPFSEKTVVEYVASALYRSEEYVFPLAVVAFEKTRGNPFMLRQLLETCYRKACIYFSYKFSCWQFNLDRVFAEFESDSYGYQLNTDFITQRLKDQLPHASRSILAWASLIGSRFSFSLIQRLLSGEFDYPDEKDGRKETTYEQPAELFMSGAEETAVEGLQACLQANILVPDEDDDHFCFGHERYQQAAQGLRECQDVKKMHFIIAQTMMDHSTETDSYALALHVCEAVDSIYDRILHRRRFREVLCQAASKATVSGARPTALLYYNNCMKLLQPDPWKEGAQDVYYKETLDVYTKVAELYWYQGQSSEVLRILAITFQHARTAADKAPSWIIKSRLYAQNGDPLSSFNALKTSLCELGLEFKSHTSWANCDEEYQRLHQELLTTGMNDLVDKPLSKDRSKIAMGAVLIEALSAAFWSDALLFYQTTVKIIEVHLHQETFIQSGLGCCYLGITSVGRFSDVSFASKMYDTGMQLLRRFEDPYTMGRGLTLSSMFTTHLVRPIKDDLVTMEEAVDYTLISGDKIVFLIAIGMLAATRLSLGLDLSELESFCAYAPEEFGDWASDLRGGVILIAVRQVARALQGKTLSTTPETIVDDDEHNSRQYLEFLRSRVYENQRPRDLYRSWTMIPLYLFGHYEAAISLGEELLPMEWSWSLRNKPMTMFYLSLSILGQIRQKHMELSDKSRSQAVLKVIQYKESIESWQSECNINYLMWSLLIEAELQEILQNHHTSIQTYEAAIDHCQVHEFALEEALAYELQAEFFVRRGATRAARFTLGEAIAAYARITAAGKVEQLSSKHEWILKNATNTRNKVSVGVQTAASIGDIGNTSLRIEENERQEARISGDESAEDRTVAWLNPRTETGILDISRMGLDVVDLQSILEFNQAISSELEIDRLLAKMTGIILETAAANFAGVVIESKDGGQTPSWSFAASGTQDGINSEAIPLTNFEDETAKQVIFYTLRFKETVFVHNVLQDERFSPNAASLKAVIALPILRGGNTIGVLYLEGQAHAFTPRILGVLELLRDQIAISITNALLFRKIQKISAANTSMIESQKRALKAARTAEDKARVAEMEALRNVKLKEEAAKAKSMFLANVSHELRTPLNGVIGMSELLKGTALNDEQEGYADSIRVCADALLTVINDILDFSKLEAGKMKLFSVPLNLHETITEVVRALSYTNLQRGLETVEDLDVDKDLLVLGDPVRLHQILMNLLSNAYKFTAKGKVTVRCRTEQENDQSIKVTISVADTGIGITQEQLSRLFKPFSQADSSTQRSYGGSGLGLSICKALIGVLNGKIWLKSQLGVGTTVSFTITFQKVTDGTVSTSTKLPAEGSDPMATWSSDGDNVLSPPLDGVFVDLSRIPRDQIRVCVAEDNPINQKIAVSFVTRLGLQCQAFGDGLQAVEALRQKSREGIPYHLVLMDVQMPVLDGYDATRLIRKDADPVVRTVLIIAMTASAIRGDREKCLEAGMNNYLAKPVRAAVLKSMLEDYLKQDEKKMPNLQAEANGLVNEVVKDVDGKDEQERQEVVALDNIGQLAKTVSVSRTRGVRKSRRASLMGKASDDLISKDSTVDRHPPATGD